MTVVDLASRRPTDRLGAPINPPVDWFYQRPDWFEDGENGIRVITTPGPDLGRAAGRPYDWETCWMNTATGRCEPVTPSPTGCEVFYSGGSTVTCVDGTVVPVGVIPYRGGHAPRRMTADESRSWMDNPAFQGLVGRIVEDSTGGVFLGQVVPELSVEDAAMIERSKVSGDWRWRYQMRDPDTGRPIGDGYDLIGVSIVSYTATPRSVRGHGRARIERGYARVAGLDPDHPNIVGPWVDLTILPEEDLMCPRCGIDHPETVACSAARLAAPEPPPEPEPPAPPAPTPPPAPEPAPEPPAPPDVGQAGGSTDLAEALTELANLGARMTEIAGSVDELGGRQDEQQARLEDLAGAVTDVEMSLAEMMKVELNADDAEKLDDLERAVSDLTRKAAETPVPAGPVPAPTAAASA